MVDQLRELVRSANVSIWEYGRSGWLCRRIILDMGGSLTTFDASNLPTGEVASGG